MKNQKESELLFNNVFEKMNISNVANEAGGLTDAQCTMLWITCLHDITIGGCGFVPDTSACELFHQFCDNK